MQNFPLSDTNASRPPDYEFCLQMRNNHFLRSHRFQWLELPGSGAHLNRRFLWNVFSVSSLDLRNSFFIAPTPWWERTGEPESVTLHTVPWKSRALCFLEKANRSAAVVGSHTDGSLSHMRQTPWQCNGSVTRILVLVAALEQIFTAVANNEAGYQSRP